MEDFTDKVALITGGSKGIGKATAASLAKAGAKVVINYHFDSAAAEELVQELGSAHAYAVQADASKMSDIDKLVEETIKKFGKIDILIPGAAISTITDLASTTEADFDRTFQMNVKGPYFLIQKCVPHMHPGSHIILFSTSQCYSSVITPEFLLHCATKGAIEQMARVLSKDLARKGICVNAIAPGATGSDSFMTGKSEEELAKLAALSPMNRIGTPDDVAKAIVWLSGQGSGWVTGQIVKVNGGMD